MFSQTFLLYFAAVVFFGTYILIASEKVHKTAAALLGAVLMLLVVLPGPSHGHAEEEGLQNIAAAFREQIQAYASLDVFSRYSDFDVIFTLAGMMVLVNILATTGVFQYVAIKCAKLAKGYPIRMMVLLVIATAVLSAFLDNVTTVLLVAPVTLVVAAEMHLSPLPFLMAETLASNIGGTATLIGDPPNLIIGSAAKFDFMAFLVNLTPVVSVILLIYCVCLWAYYSKRLTVTAEHRARIMDMDEAATIVDPVNLRRGGIIMLLTIVGFLLHGMVGLQPSVVAMSGATLALICCRVNVEHALEKIEWGTLFFFMGLFVLVSGAQKAGLMDIFGKVLQFTDSWPVPVTLLAVMWLSAFAGAVMNNVSFTAAMAVILGSFLQTSPNFQTPELQNLMWWGLALSVCLGGNGTLVGAAANLVVAGLAEKGGCKVSFGTFLRYGVPVTVGSMVVASIYILARYFYVTM